MKRIEQDSKPQWVDITVAARQASRHPSTMRRWVTAGAIPSRVLPSGRIQVDAGSLTQESMFQRKVDSILRGIISAQ